MTDDWRLPTGDWHDFTTDASHFPGGHAARVVFPSTTADVVDLLASAPAVLTVGAQSSLTGGATPMGETVLSTANMSRILEISRERVTVEPGVTVAVMQEALAGVGAWFPPAPTFAGATAGGIVSTNAAGAATFKYGSTRDWVEALTVVLADGTVLELTRDAVKASGGRLSLQTNRGRIRVPVPGYAMPRVPKRSAGYYAAPDMDAVDLFIGSEGTLGVVTRVTFRALAPAPRVALAFVCCPSERAALSVVADLRASSLQTWRDRNPTGLDVSAVEHMDRRSLEIASEDGAARRHHISIPGGTDVALLVQLELPAEATDADAFDEIQNALEPGAGGSLTSFCRLLDRAGLLADCEIALPGDRRRAEDFVALREAVPAGVNARVGAAKQADVRIEKTAADMIVPFDRVAEMMEAYRSGFESRGLDYAIWGHLSDGNVHPNVIPRTYDDVVSGQAAILELGRVVERLGGCPLAEHGVGRNPVKQALLRQLYGDEGVAQMRAVKRALDPAWKLAPGVIFPRP